MSRTYCFTINEDADTYFTSLRERNWGSQDRVRAICFQLEVAPSTGRRHVQGFVRFFRTHRVRGAQLALSLPPSTHFESARGSDADNLRYCSKEDSRVDDTQPFRFGNFGNQGERNDLKGVVDAIRDRTFDPLEYLSVQARYPKFISYWDMLLGRPPIKEKEVYWIYGPTGTGKSRWAWERDPDLYPLASYNPEWWDGYIGQRTVLFDEFDIKSLKLDRILRICDRYPVMVPRKGAFSWLKAEQIIICSNKRYDECYPVDDAEISSVQLDALARRITQVIHMNGELNLIDLS